MSVREGEGEGARDDGGPMIVKPLVGLWGGGAIRGVCVRVCVCVWLSFSTCVVNSRLVAKEREEREEREGEGLEAEGE